MADELKLNLGITDEGLKGLAAEAIYRALTETAREKLIQDSIKQLLTQSGTSYGSRTSPLEDAFRAAMRVVAEKIVAEELEKDDKVQAEVRKLVAEAWAKMMDEDSRGKITKQIADALAKAFVPDRY